MIKNTSSHDNSTWESSGKTCKSSTGKFFQGSHKIAKAKPIAVAPNKSAGRNQTRWRRGSDRMMRAVKPSSSTQWFWSRNQASSGYVLNKCKFEINGFGATKET